MGQQFAKGGLAAANNQIQQPHLMKVMANYFKIKVLPVEPSL
jgi:hypothetical protein